MSCKNEKIIVKGEETLFDKKDDYIVEKPCVGCEKKTALNHNGNYVIFMDWVNDKPLKFVDIVSKNNGFI